MNFQSANEMDKKNILKLIVPIVIALAFFIILINAGSGSQPYASSDIPLYNPATTNFNYVPININGYDYMSNNSWYTYFIKSHSNYGDGTQFCRTINGTQVCLTYQAQDYSYRDINSAQDYLSSINSVVGTVSGNTMSYSNIFSNVDLSFTANQNGIKENYIIKSMPRIPASSLNQSTITLDFGGYIKYNNLQVIQANGTNQTGKYFTTNDQINFVYGNQTVFYLPKPYAVDSAGNSINIQYQVYKSGNNVWFYVRTPYSWLNDSSRVFPVFIDPSDFSPACSDDGTTITCNASTGYTGSYIDTTENINISNTKIDDSNTGLRINSSQGWIDMSNSYLNLSTNQGTYGYGYVYTINLYGNSNSIINNSIIRNNQSEEDAPRGTNAINLNFNNNLTIQNSYFYQNIIDYSGPYSGGEDGPDNEIYINSSYTNLIGNNYFYSIGGSGTINQGPPPPAICVNGGKGLLYIYGNFSGINSAHIQISGGYGAAQPYSGQTQSSGGNGGNAYIYINSNLFNYSGLIVNQNGVSTGQFSTCTGAIYGNSYIYSNNIYTQLIFNNGNVTGNQYSNLNATEFTLNNFQYTSTSALNLNLTNDIARIGLFGNSTRPSFTPIYSGTFGGIIIGNSTSGLTLTGINYTGRDSSSYFVNYYGPLSKPTSPANNSNGSSSPNFNFSSLDDNNLKNITLNVWNSTGNLISSNLYQNISGTSNTSSISFSLPGIGNYTFGAITCNNQGICDNGALYNFTYQLINTCSYSGSGNWLISSSDFCNISTNTNLNTNNITINGSGLTTVTANITNFTKVTLIGINSTSISHVICKNGGCFK